MAKRVDPRPGTGRREREVLSNLCNNEIGKRNQSYRRDEREGQGDKAEDGSNRSQRQPGGSGRLQFRRPPSELAWYARYFAGLGAAAEVQAGLRLAARVFESSLDAIFIADFLGLNRSQVANRSARHFEPLTAASHLAAMTSRIGLVITISTQFTEPYNTARQLNSLDWLSQGRIGWNVVTSFNGERNYGYWYEDKKQQMWKDFRVAVAVGMEVVRAKQLALFMIAFILRGTDFCPNSFQPRISIREFIYRLIDKVIEWKHIEGRRMDEGDDIPYVTRMLDHLTYWKVKNVHLVFPNCPLAALT